MRIKKQVVHYKNLSRKGPMYTTILWFIIIKVYDLLDTTIGTLFVGAVSIGLIAIWCMTIYDVFKYEEEPIDIFKPKETTQEDAKNNSMRRNRRQPMADDEDDEFRGTV